MKVKRTADMNCFDKSAWMESIEASNRKDVEMQAFLEKQFPDCKWSVYALQATGEIQMHRSLWAFKFEEKLDGLWSASLLIKNIDVQFNALTAPSLKEAVFNLKQRLRHYSDQFAKLSSLEFMEGDDAN